jgi:hypothetical protein
MIRFRDPIYETTFYVWQGPLEVYNTEVNRRFKENRPVSPGCAARTRAQGRHVHFWFDKSIKHGDINSAAIVAHEAVHGMQFVMSRIGHVAGRLDEPEAYYTDFLVRNILKAIKKGCH